MGFLSTRFLNVFTPVWTLLRLGRPANILMIGAAVLLGRYLGSGDIPEADLLYASIAAGLLGAAGNIMNDLVDFESDVINHPERALPSKQVSIQKARIFLLVCLVFSLMALATLSPIHWIVYGFSALLLVAYNWILERTPLFGNLAVSLLVGLSIVFGALQVGFSSTVLVAGGFAFFTTLAREIVKDVADMEGDRHSGFKTLPLSIGSGRSLLIVNTILISIVAASILPFLLLEFGGLYLLVVICTNIFLLLSVQSQESELFSAERVSTTLKWAMVTGMFALVMAESVPSP